MRLSSPSAFFPAYNEAGNIKRLVETWHPVLAHSAEEFEIIIVDDGSADETARETERMAERFDRVRLVRHPVNRGYGGAVKTGLAESRLDYVFFTDADLQFDPKDLGLLCRHIEGADLVTGYRVGRKDHAIRRFNGWAWGAFIRLMLPVRVRDIDCAFKLFRRSALDEIDVSTLEAEGAFLSTEILVRMARAGHRIREVPVSHLPRLAGEQSGADARVILRAFRELLRHRRRLLR